MKPTKVLKNSEELLKEVTSFELQVTSDKRKQGNEETSRQVDKKTRKQSYELQGNGETS